MHFFVKYVMVSWPFTVEYQINKNHFNSATTVR